MAKSELRKLLPAHYVNPIYSKLNGKYKKTYIREVVQKGKGSIEILEAALELAEELKKKRDLIAQKMADLKS